MKKIISIGLSLVLAAGLLTGCQTPSTPEASGEKLRIVTTIFPEYDWVPRQAVLMQLLHLFQPVLPLPDCGLGIKEPVALSIEPFR